jgi:hypothetical protein
MPKDLAILRNQYGVGMEDELFEQNMTKLRSILGWKNVRAGEVHTFPSN